MTSKSLLVIVLLATSAVGCAMGPSLIDFPTAQAADGLGLRVEVGKIEYGGELLEVRADALVLHTFARIETKSGEERQMGESLVRRLPFDRVTRVSHWHNKGGALSWKPGDSAGLERLRLFSRFPQGLTPDLMQQLLKSLGQAELVGGMP